MKKISDISTASEKYDAPLEPEKVRDRMTLELEAQGHKVIAIGRAIAIVEQCEPNDDFPKGACSDPLKITFHGDFEGTESALFIHAGRYGLMEVFEQIGSNFKKLVPIDSETAKRVSSIDQGEAAQAIRDLLDFHLQPGFRRRISFDLPAFENAMGFSPLEKDDLLEKFADEAKTSLDNYLKRLAELRSAEDEL